VTGHVTCTDERNIRPCSGFGTGAENCTHTVPFTGSTQSRGTTPGLRAAGDAST